jgi:peptide/nickel transport system substrate-binding protein
MDVRKRASRRDFIRIGLLGTSAALLAACGQQAPAAAPTAAPAAPGQFANAQPAVQLTPTAASKPAAPAADAKPTAASAAAAKPTEAPKPQEAPKPAGDAKPAIGAVADVKQVPRNRTMVLSFAGTGAAEGRWTDYELWNRYALGANMQNGGLLFYEPVYYYSAFADKWIPWLAEDHTFSPDFKQMTYKIRSGIKWSDGVPFTAEDIAFTLNSLRDFGPKVALGNEVQQAVAEAKATDDTTLVINFKLPSPRWNLYMAFGAGLGIYIVPKHVFSKVDDWSKFTFYDPDKGWPLSTTQWKVVHTSPQQKLIDRKDSWWAAERGLSRLSKVERLVYIAYTTETQAAQLYISNQLDSSLDVRPATMEQILAQNPKVTTWTGNEKPYGYTDQWPTNLMLNNEKPPFNDKDIRWAISNFIDRDKVVQIGNRGAGSRSPLPLPNTPAIRPYFDAVKDLLAKNDTNEFNPTKGAALLEGKGYKKGADGMWAKDGEKLTLPINGWAVFSDIGPVVSEMLKQQGVDATYQTPPDYNDQALKGTYTGYFTGTGGSWVDPYFHMRLFQSASSLGSVPVNISRWKNEAYDKIVDEFVQTPLTEKDKLLGLYVKAMEQWIPNLPAPQITEWYHRIPMNQTYWSGWPTNKDPYVNSAFWHWTFPLMLEKFEPTQ